jgi:PKD repeat protein
VDVNWNDGTTHTTVPMASPGTILQQTHTFGEEGSYTVTVTVTNTSDSQSDSKTFVVTVTDPAVVQGPAVAVSAV